MKITKIVLDTAKNGNPMKRVSLDQKVNDRDMLFVFSEHTRFNDIQEGMELGPNDVVADGQYIKLVDPDAGIKGRSGSRSGMITQAMNKKNEMISHAQENKEESIKMASTIRMAVDVVTAFRPTELMSEQEIKQAITDWRAWFYVNWNEVNTDNTPPF